MPGFVFTLITDSGDTGDARNGVLQTIYWTAAACLELIKEDMLMFSFRIADKADVDAVFSLMEQVVHSLADPSLFIPETRQSLERHLKEEGMILLAEEERLAGYLMVRFPGNAEDNLAEDAGLSAQDALRCAHMESVVVHPDFRGRGLQKLLLEQAERLLPEGIGFALATVAPENHASLISFLRMGYSIADTKMKYGGKMRHIMIKKVTHTQDQK